MIRPVRDAGQVDQVRDLLREYAAGLDADWARSGVEAELRGLPHPYAPPGGELLLAHDSQGVPLGCVGLRRLDADRTELKRLFVRPAARGQGTARALLRAAIEAARGLGGRQLVLDTMPSMHAAATLYRAAGFIPVAPYAGERPGLLFFGLDLTR